MTDKKHYTETNRNMWNVTAKVHRDSGYDEMFKRVTAADYSSFDDVEERIFNKINLKGKEVIQICCNNGRETISVKKAGAARCVGVDISDEFIAQAKALAQGAGQAVTFIRSSVYELDHAALGQFDVVYITIGALGWMPDLQAFFDVIEKLLKPGGYLFLYEMHPILNGFNPEPPHARDASYFRVEPFKEESLPEYMDKEGVGNATSYWFVHTMASIITQCIEHGLMLVDFAEYPDDLSDTYKALDGEENALPLSFSLLALKTV